MQASGKTILAGDFFSLCSMFSKYFSGGLSFPPLSQEKESELPHSLLEFRIPSVLFINLGVYQSTGIFSSSPTNPSSPSPNEIHGIGNTFVSEK